MKYFLATILVCVPQLVMAEMYSQCGPRPSELSWKTAPAYFDEAGEVDLRVYGKKQKATYRTDKKNHIIFEIPMTTLPVTTVYDFDIGKCDGYQTGSVKITRRRGWLSEDVAEYPCVCAVD
jgi:hypothetical protein